MSSWLNDDGLLVKFGTDSYKSVHTAGEYLTANGKGEQVVEVVVDLTELTATDTILNDTVFIPANAHITSVETVVVVAATSGGAATLDVGLIARDRSTEVDHDGFVAAAALSTINEVGETTAGAGALVGAEMTSAGGAYVSAAYGTAAYTAGKVKVRIAYVPNGIDNA